MLSSAYDLTRRSARLKAQRGIRALCTIAHFARWRTFKVSPPELSGVTV